MFVFSAFAIAMSLSACAPTPKPIDNSQRINAGIEIVPEAVLAAQRIPPSDRATTGDQLDLIDVISDSDQKHYKLIELLRESGLVPMLQSTGPYTILAPTDDAFNKLPPGVLDRLMQPAHHDQLVAFLKYHILPGRIELADMLQTNGQIPTLGGANVIIKGIGDKAMVNDANVIRSESSAANGVVHWVDNVMIPPV
jgi:uncharacterized surface protein with fasciclin (FAS1) repeats